MKSVLISIKPQWCEKIASGRKTIEVRKSAPKEVPFKAYIYCTKTKNKWSLSDYEGAYQNSVGEIVYAQQHVIGEFICDKTYPIKAYTFDGGDAARGRWKLIQTFLPAEKEHKILFGTCLSTDEMYDYIGEGKFGYAWHISDLKIYDKPKKLSKFKISCNRKNLCYSCNRFTSKPWDICNNTIIRPPQSYMFVEEI